MDCPSIGFHGSSLRVLPVKLVDRRIPVRTVPALMARAVAQGDPEAEEFTFVPVRPSERFMPVELPITPAAAITKAGVFLDDRRGIAVTVHRQRSLSPASRTQWRCRCNRADRLTRRFSRRRIYIRSRRYTCTGSRCTAQGSLIGERLSDQRQSWRHQITCRE